MKRILIFAAALAALFFTACGDTEDVASNRAGEKKLSGVEALLEQAKKTAGAETAGAETAGAETAEPSVEGQTIPAESPEEVRAYLEELRAMTPVSWDAAADVDLTKMNATMIYATVSDMMTYPSRYRGKTVKMTGTLSVLREEVRDYYACVIQDATACCASGVEFVPVAAFSYPKDFPADGAKITVIGVFDTYTERGSMYCQLIACQLKAA